MVIGLRVGHLIAFGCILLIAASPEVAGDNKEAMQNQAKHLIDVNADVLKQLSEMPSNGQVSLQADVVQRDGKTEIRIGKVDIDPQTSTAKSTSSIRVESLAVPNAATSNKVRFGPVVGTYTNPILEDSKPGSKADTSENPVPPMMAAAADEFVAAHPGSRARVLTDSEQEKLDWGSGAKPAGAVVIFWGK